MKTEILDSRGININPEILDSGGININPEILDLGGLEILILKYLIQGELDIAILQRELLISMPKY